MVLAAKMCELSGGRMRLAHNEKDTDTSAQPGAAHFIKLDEKRLGRDIELYGFMGKVQGLQRMTVSLLEELVMPIKKECPGSYKAACEVLGTFGDKVFDAEMAKEWRDILAS